MQSPPAVLLLAVTALVLLMQPTGVSASLNYAQAIAGGGGCVSAYGGSTSTATFSCPTGTYIMDIDGVYRLTSAGAVTWYGCVLLFFFLTRENKQQWNQRVHWEHP